MNPRDVRSDRQAVYGDCAQQHANCGLAWTAILQQHYGIVLPHPIPGHVVALMQTATKACRAATPLEFNADTYVDGQAYFQIASEIDKRNPNNKETKP